MMVNGKFKSTLTKKKNLVYFHIKVLYNIVLFDLYDLIL